MPVFLDTRGRSTLGIGICGRCSRKMPLEELFSDPNSPGLRVCIDDLDVLDPYRLPARQTEDINLPFVRPDLPLTDNLTQGTGIPQAPGQFPTFNVLSQRLVDDQNRAILDSNGNYIDMSIAPNPKDLP